MIFGKIDYLNLLPFHVFMKKHLQHSQFKASINHRKGVPSQVNQAFKQRRVDAAFISSVEAVKYKKVNLGIIAKKEVLSVLVIPGKAQEDTASATSNVLAKVLDVKGRVLIGDKALAYHLTHDDGIDLAKLWYEKHHLPFVFATLSYHKHEKQLQSIARKFSRKHVPIPYYIIKKASLKSGISIKDIKYYLSKISYTLDYKAKQSLYTFMKQKRKHKNDTNN